MSTARCRPANWREQDQPRTKRQSLEALPKYSFRVTFGEDPTAVVYDLIRFQTTRLGRQELELRSTTKLPFVMTILLDRTGKGEGTLHYSPHLEGCTAAQVDQAARALIAMTRAGVFELYAPDAGKRFLRLHSSGTLPEWAKDLAQIAEAAVKVSTFYGADLCWPTALTDEDLRNLDRLNQLISGVPLRLNSFDATITKIGQLPETGIRETLVFSFDCSTHGRIQVFGTYITAGPLQLTFTDGCLRNEPGFAAFLREAPIGTDFDLQITNCTGAVASAIPRSAPATSCP